MPGSLSDPVVLDPFTTITEVGWPGRYLAFQFAGFFAGLTGAAGETCSGVGAPDPAATNRYMSAAVIGYSQAPFSTADEGILAGSVNFWETTNGGKAWNTRNFATEFLAAGGTLSGMPTLTGTVNFSLWEYAGFSHPAITVWTSGPSLGITTPVALGDDGVFSQGLSGLLSLRAQPITTYEGCHGSEEYYFYGPVETVQSGNFNLAAAAVNWGGRNWDIVGADVRTDSVTGERLDGLLLFKARAATP